jgi:transcriptional regulator with XRE-family HTH domain
MISERIKKLRKEYNLSQQELGEKLGITQGSLANYEKGIRFPNPDALISIARFFNVSIDYLMGVSKNRGVLDEEEIKNDPDLLQYAEKKRPVINGVPLNNKQWEMIIVFLKGIRRQLEEEGKISFDK